MLLWFLWYHLTTWWLSLTGGRATHELQEAVRLHQSLNFCHWLQIWPQSRNQHYCPPVIFSFSYSFCLAQRGKCYVVKIIVLVLKTSITKSFIITSLDNKRLIFNIEIHFAWNINAFRINKILRLEIRLSNLRKQYHKDILIWQRWPFYSVQSQDWTQIVVLSVFSACIIYSCVKIRHSIICQGLEV